MANYYIGGVGRVQAFINTEKGLEHYFDARTLTDSAISISTSAEEIRGGEGAQLLGKFFHTSVFNLNMTDALFDLKYLAAQVGSTIETGDTKHFETETVTISGGKAKLSKQPVPISDGDTWCHEGANLIAWYKGCDDDEYKTVKVNEDNTIDFDTPFNGKKICVTYPINKEGQQITVKAMYYPKEFIIYLTAKLFAGDACTPSTGSYVGEIVVEIPRFQLDGAVDLSLNMSSPATMQLNGSAYANGCGCDEEQWYAKITQVMLDEDARYKGYNGIVVFNSEDLHAGDEVFVYAIGEAKTPKRYTGAFTAVYDSTTSAIDGNNKIVEGAKSKAVTVTISDGILKGKTATFTVQA